MSHRGKFKAGGDYQHVTFSSILDAYTITFMHPLQYKFKYPTPTQNTYTEPNFSF